MMAVGWSEMMVLVVVALLIFGPHELPQVLRTAGGYMRQFRRMTSDLRREFDKALREAEREIDLEERRPTGDDSPRPEAAAKEEAPESDVSRRHPR